MERVAALLAEWAAELELAPEDRQRWRAAGLLHDALRDAPPDELRPLVPAGLGQLSPGLLHGPAAAERLRQEGVDDEPLLRAVAFHTLGHPELDTLGRALFIADYIEPGRTYEPARLAVLRARMPAASQDVLREVLSARIARLLTEGRPIRSETTAFWNALNALSQGGTPMPDATPS
jgi:HD superfamily phosphohydrolase YqeK